MFDMQYTVVVVLTFKFNFIIYHSSVHHIRHLRQNFSLCSADREGERETFLFR